MTNPLFWLARSGLNVMRQSCVNGAKEFHMQDLKGKTLIVVGGGGYIGSHVCKAVHDAGGIPVTFDNFISGHEHAVKWGPSETVDLRDRGTTLAACKKHSGAYAVIHLASSIEVGIGEKQPTEFYTNNVVGALNLLDGMIETGLDKLIFSSTCATYGETDQMPLLESQVQQPFSVYGKTKLAIEHMIQSYHKVPNPFLLSLFFPDQIHQ